jgi:hypothetical protein
MPSVFRRIADELDPNLVPAWASRNRRRVPTYAKRLLAVFGPWWLPRLGLSLVLVGGLVVVAAMITFAARSWVVAILVFVVGVLTTAVGSLMWSAYRMRHWLPGAPAATAPLAPPIPRRAWAWMVLAIVVSLGGLGVMMWLMVADGSPRAIVLGVGIFTGCGGTAGAVLLRQADAISSGSIGLAGWPVRRLSLLIFVAGLILAATLMAQAPMLQATR